MKPRNGIEQALDWWETLTDVYKRQANQILPGFGG